MTGGCQGMLSLLTLVIYMYSAAEHVILTHFVTTCTQYVIGTV